MDVINLGGGMPDPMPDFLTRPLTFAASLNAGGDPAGDMELRRALAHKLLRDQGLSFDPSSEIVMTTGAKQALLPALFAMIEPGDEVLTLDPCWVSYAPTIRLAGGIPRPAPLARSGHSFRLDPALLREFVSDRTRAIIVNTPHNPTGRVFTHDELNDVATLALDRNLWVLSDESFDKFVFDGHCHISIAALEGMKHRTVVVQSFSKAFALPGARVGYAAGPASICAAMSRFNEHVITCVSPFTQSLALRALSNEKEWTAALQDAFRVKRAAIEDFKTSLPGVRLVRTEGTFYALADISARNASSEAFARWLLDTANVAVTPGIAFGAGAEGFIRVNLVGSLDAIRAGFSRIQAALA
jgi:aspartate aminotransferase